MFRQVVTTFRLGIFRKPRLLSDRGPFLDGPRTLAAKRLRRQFEQEVARAGRLPPQQSFSRSIGSTGAQ